MLDTADYILRVAAAGGLGAVIGLERQSRNQLAGVRTHALVATGAAVFTLAGAFGFPGLHRGPNVDPMRVAAQIASGIGFIGAGTIIRDRGSVRGITTAAALWVSAAVGLAAGAALWGLAISGAVVTLLVLVVLRPVRSRLLTFTSPHYTVNIEYQRGHGTLGPLLDGITEAGGHVDDISIHDDVNGRRAVTLDVRVHADEDLREAVRLVSGRDEVARCTVHRG